MPVKMARNTMGGPTVLSSDPKGTHYVEWQGAGDPAGGDIQPVPEEVQNTVQFQKAVRRGVIILIDDDTDDVVTEAMNRQQAAWDQRQGQTQATAEQHIEQTTNKDMVVQTCVGPSPRAGSACGVEVPVRDGQKDEKPPLCAMHVELAPQYIAESTIKDGKPAIQWIRATLGARERQQ